MHGRDETQRSERAGKVEKLQEASHSHDETETAENSESNKNILEGSFSVVSEISKSNFAIKIIIRKRLRTRAQRAPVC